MVLKRAMLGLAAAAALTLAGCGTSQGDRAVSGGLLGAGAGALVGSVTGSAATGAAIGAVGGAAIGALTDPCDLNLGDPAWNNDRGAYERRCNRPYRDRR